MQELEVAAGNARAPGIGTLWSRDVMHLAACLETVMFCPSFPYGQGETLAPRRFLFSSGNLSTLKRASSAPCLRGASEKGENSGLTTLLLLD